MTRLRHALLLASLLAGCSCEAPIPGACDTTADCDPGEDCVDGRCRLRMAADASTDAPIDAPPAGCGTCVGDTHCVAGACVPWADGAVAACTAPVAPFAVSPRVLCHWPPVGAPLTEGPAEWQWARRVTSTIVAATFLPSRGEFEDPPTWLVFATGSGLGGITEDAPAYTQRRGGVLRVLDPQTCTLIDTLDEVPVASWFEPAAIGDLDGDGVPEIVAQAWDDRDPGGTAMSYASSGRLVAWRWDAATSRFRVAHQSTVAGAPEADLAYSGAYVMMAGPSIADLDDDGAPEVLLGGRVYDRELRRLTGQAPPSSDLFMSRAPPGGPFVIQADVVADLDGDARMELVYGHGIWTWAGDRWMQAPFFAPPVPLGLAHGVVAQLGDLEGTTAGDPEIVAVGYDGVRIQSLDGRVIRRFDLPTADRGGSAPSIANLDGDPTPEILVGLDRGLYAIDLGCDVDAPGPECGRDTTGTGDPLPRGVRWADRPPLDAWDYMGATTFDFDRDGALEVVYADECFLRVYDGATGEVLYSHWRPSRTASEVPIVVGTNGGADTVIAIGLHTDLYCSQATGVGAVPPYDPQFPGLACESDGDCAGPAGSCVAGRCRCTTDADCCAPGSGSCAAVGFACHPSTDAMGNTCRAVRVPDPSAFSRDGALEEGVDVLTDAYGRWGAARPLWNQDAYHVTNVLDDGRIPRTRDAIDPWVDPNAFRSNAPAAERAAAAADLTVRAVRAVCTAGTATALEAELCNRGTRSATSGQTVRFTTDATVHCDAASTEVVPPGECIRVTCAAAPAIGASVIATANPDRRTPECGVPEENASAATALACGP